MYIHVYSFSCNDIILFVSDNAGFSDSTVADELLLISNINTD